MLNVLEDIVKYHYFRLDSRDEVLNFTLRYVAECEDMEIRKQGMELLDGFAPDDYPGKEKADVRGYPEDVGGERIIIDYYDNRLSGRTTNYPGKEPKDDFLTLKHYIL